ncbi:MAG: hypothetical protein EOO09_10995 [Chitinophagaceae bacterium]|nr:MAG: hypothetical protein EOO09_10995 [Chitinophagaceae bacterium]
MAQEVKIFFGEFGDMDITPTATWFSDISQFALVLVSPDGKETTLKATAKEQYYSASFTPDANGIYTLAMHHVVKQVYNGMVLDYNSSATVKVGTGEPKLALSKNVIAVLPSVKANYAINQQVSVQAFFEGKPAGNKELEVVAPNGWVKKLYTDSLGFASFIPLWSGKYNVEYTSTEKKTGAHQSAPYESWYYCSTMIITVGKN